MFEKEKLIPPKGIKEKKNFQYSIESRGPIYVFVSITRLLILTEMYSHTMVLRILKTTTYCQTINAKAPNICHVFQK